MVDQEEKYYQARDPLHLIILGDMACGKSCLYLRFCDNIFRNSYRPTLMSDSKIKSIDYSGRKLMLQIWDYSWRDKYNNENIYQMCHGFIFVFDLTRRKSFISLSNWINDGNEFGKPFIIIGAKSDLESQRQVTFEEAREFAEINNACYIEVSNANGHNVEKAFKLITYEIISRDC